MQPWKTDVKTNMMMKVRDRETAKVERETTYFQIAVNLICIFSRLNLMCLFTYVFIVNHII